MPTDIKKDLRELFLIRPNVVFLNHGSFGACPKPVFAAYQAWQEELERQPVEFLGRRFADLMQNAREQLGLFIGAETANLVYVPNTTTALNIVAQSLSLSPGDEVLTTNLEYGAMDRAWQAVCTRQKARYIQQTIPLPIAAPEDFVETLWQGVTPRTKVLFLSHITSITAITLPLTELTRRARSRGIITVIDGAHVPGQLPIALEELDVDFYAGNCHKWLMSPKGSAFLYARDAMQSMLHPLIVSWGDKSSIDSAFIQENEFQGTRDIAAFLSVPAAIDFFHAHNWPEVQKYCHELVLSARRKMIEISSLPATIPETGGWFQQMFAQPLPPCDSVMLQNRLYSEFNVEIPISIQHDRPYIRISIQGYNSTTDVERFTQALAALLPEVMDPPA